MIRCAECDGELGMLRIGKGHLRLGHVKEPHPIHPPRFQPASEAVRVRGERPPAERRDGPLRSPRTASLGVGERLTATEKAV